MTKSHEKQPDCPCIACNSFWHADRHTNCRDCCEKLREWLRDRRAFDYGLRRDRQSWGILGLCCFVSCLLGSWR